MTSSSWRIGQRSSSTVNRVYDFLRRRVNERLVRFLDSACSGDGRHHGKSRTPELRVLEAGSGTAYAASLFRTRAHVAHSVCLDLDVDALREARRRDPSLSAVVGELCRMPFRDEVFDLVFNSSTVEHISTPVSAVREMGRVCRYFGRVFVGVPYSFGPLGFEPLIRRTRAGIWLGPVFSSRKLDELLHRSGLKPLAHIRYFLWFFVGALAGKYTVETARRPLAEPI